MDIKLFFREVFESFFIIFTCAILGMSLYLHILGSASVQLPDIAAIFVISILTALVGFVLYSRREPKRFEMLIRLAVHLLLVLGITLAVASYMGWILWSMPITVIRFAGLVIGIFVSVHAIIFYQSKKLTDDLNKKLKERYKR